MSDRPRLVVHAHFYQPLRVDPFTGIVPADPSAAPHRDWAARITAECYGPIAERDTLEHASWDLGPTLAAYLREHRPDVLEGFARADHAGGDGRTGPAIAQAYHHAILPLASARDRRTEIAWGARAFELAFGRRPTAMWLPETAADLVTLRALADAGVAATILAPWQADVTHLEDRTPYRVETGGGRHVTVAFYDGDLSGSISFEPRVTADADHFARERVAPRLAGRLADGRAPALVIASDGELYGHHQAFRDLFLDRLVAPDASIPDRGFDVVGLADIAGGPHLPEIRIRDRTSWSCHHGVARWSAECPCVADGRWKGPLRAALERLAGGIDAASCLIAAGLGMAEGPWAARDAYIDVVEGAADPDEFAAARLGPGATADDRRRLLDLLEAQRWRLAMFASDGWYWDDPWRPETRQVLLFAARAARLLEGHGARGLEVALLDDLASVRSPSRHDDGAVIYRHALSEIGQPPPRG